MITGTAAAAFALFELVVVSAITQAVLVLPMRMYFHRAAILGLPANVLVLPLAGVMLNAGVAAIALSYVSLPFARLAAWLAACLASLDALAACIRSPIFISRSGECPIPAPLLALVAAAGILLAFVAARRQRAMALAGLAALFVSAA